MYLVRPLLVIVGPTGSGKSDLAIRVARHCSGEVLSADSQQVYQGMDIGTGKATAAERAEVPHHLLDVLSPDQEMSAARFACLADEVIKTLQDSDRPVIVAGGTMLYVRALLRGLFEGPAADVALRAELSEESERAGASKLWQDLRDVDPSSAERIHKTDLRRIIRALEVFRITGVPLSTHHERHQAEPPRYRAKLLGLKPERERLYQQINDRVERMMAAGLVDEVQGLRKRGFGPELRSQQAIGYAEVHSMLDGDLSTEEMVRLIQRNSRRYARRQLSWYRGDDRVHWSAEASMVDLGDLERYLGGQIDD